MKKIILALILLLITGCSTETVILEEISDNLITGGVVAEFIEDTALDYDFIEGETKIILGKTITVSDIQQKPEVTLLVDGVSGKLLETKNQEIINYMKISINKVDLSDINNKKVTLKIEELNLENNEYIITQNQKISIEDKDVILTEGKSSGKIYVTVYDKGTIKGDEAIIASGETVEVYGLIITNIENYYRNNQYALIFAQESWSS